MSILVRDKDGGQKSDENVCKKVWIRTGDKSEKIKVGKKAAMPANKYSISTRACACHEASASSWATGEYRKQWVGRGWIPSGVPGRGLSDSLSIL